jgi:hypothetical protein
LVGLVVHQVLVLLASQVNPRNSRTAGCLASPLGMGCKGGLDVFETLLKLRNLKHFEFDIKILTNTVQSS